MILTFVYIFHLLMLIYNFFRLIIICCYYSTVPHPCQYPFFAFRHKKQQKIGFVTKNCTQCTNFCLIYPSKTLKTPHIHAFFYSKCTSTHARGQAHAHIKFNEVFPRATSRGVLPEAGKMNNYNIAFPHKITRLHSIRKKFQKDYKKPLTLAR